ncbi:PepSY1/2 domain-containing protein [Halonatronum saccharophilum]|uniref:PepSY1/2 domain-containing protein n=1 Tax=Halonatronum saccharophilum TaxID=150060 RepID=UPI00047F959B|nr:PepSY1/2 domain-containing protein [Halonatronum saccharophilum]
MDWKVLVLIALVFAVGAVGYWGYDQYTTLGLVQNELDTRYENSFQGFNTHIDELESQLGTILVSNDPENLSVNLSQIWRSTYSAQEDLGQIPISDSSMENVKGLLHKVLQFTEHLDKKVVDGGLDEEDKEMVQSFHNQVSLVHKNIETVHDKMNREQFKWHDKRRVSIDPEDREYSASPIAGLIELNDNLDLSDLRTELESILPDGIFDFQPRDIITALIELEGEDIDQEEAIEVAKEFMVDPAGYDFEVINNEQVDIEGQTTPASIPAYTVRATNGNDENEVIYIDVSKRGGNVIYLLNQRRVGERNIEIEEAKDNAVVFLEENGFEGIEPVSSKTFNDLIIISLAPVMEDVVIKPDAITVQVALDNGDIVGFNGLDYLLNHQERDLEILEPKLTKEEAEEKISRNLALKREPRLILDKRGEEEFLAYEFIGEVDGGEDGELYKVEIDAEDGREVLVKSLDEDFYKEVR